MAWVTAMAQVQSLAQEFLHASGAAKKKKKIAYLCIYIYFLLFRAAPAAYGHSQARDLIRAAAASLPHSHICNLHHSSWQRWILNPLIEVRDRARNLMVPSQIRFH